MEVGAEGLLILAGDVGKIVGISENVGPEIRCSDIRVSEQDADSCKPSSWDEVVSAALQLELVALLPLQVEVVRPIKVICVSDCPCMVVLGPELSAHVICHVFRTGYIT